MLEKQRRRPPGLRPKQGCRGRQGLIMLGFAAVVIIYATFLIFQKPAWRTSALLGPFGWGHEAGSGQ